MAKLISITEAPASSIVFANNPIAFKATTYYTLAEEESFLRIICRATFTLDSVPPYYKGNTKFEVELSQPVENMGTATFNLSDAAQTIVRSVQSQIDMDGGDALYPYSVLAEVNFEDVWIKDNQQISGVLEHLRPSASFRVVPGGMTDYEMYVHGERNLALFTSEGKEMTRKPDGGIVYAGERMIVPVLRGGNNTSATASVKFLVGETEIYSSSDIIEGLKLDYQTALPENKATEGEFVFNSSLTGPITGYYRTNPHGVHFLRFINGFGAVENISVRSKDKLSYEVSGETHSLVQEATTRPTDRRYATKSQPVGVYELSSGYVPQRWAEWYVQELLTSPRVWIQLGGRWVPALIEAEDDCVIYDRTKPEMPHVDFTLRLAIDGVTGVTW